MQELPGIKQFQTDLIGRLELAPLKHLNDTSPVEYNSSMKINPTDNDRWISPQYLILNGRIRTKGIQFPRRERVMVRKALERMHIRYKELVPVVNPFHHNWKETHTKGISWLDFTIFIGRLAVLLFHPQYGQSGVKPHEWKAFQAKKDLLESRDIPYVILNRKSTSYEYEIMIRKMIRRK